MGFSRDQQWPAHRPPMRVRAASDGGVPWLERTRHLAQILGRQKTKWHLQDQGLAARSCQRETCLLFLRHKDQSHLQSCTQTRSSGGEASGHVAHSHPGKWERPASASLGVHGLPAEAGSTGLGAQDAARKSCGHPRPRPRAPDPTPGREAEATRKGNLLLRSRGEASTGRSRSGVRGPARGDAGGSEAEGPATAAIQSMKRKGLQDLNSRGKLFSNHSVQLHHRGRGDRKLPHNGESTMC